jgi:hypothetical protein
MARYDDLNTSTIGYATVISCLGLLLIVLAIQALTFSWIGGEEERKLANSHYFASDADIAAQNAQLSSYAEVEVEVIPATEAGAPPAEPVKQKRIHIPLNQAQSLLKKELGKTN